MLVDDRFGVRLGWLRLVSVPLFAAGMGLNGLGLAWRRAGQVFGWPGVIGEALLFLTLAAVLGLLATYAAKAVRHWLLVVQEFNHPLKVNFFPAISINLMLLAAVLLPYAASLAAAIWLAGAALHFGLTVAIIGRWMTRPVDIQQLNPTWFIPAVGNIAAPLAGVPLGFVELSWLFFGAGMLFWGVLLPIVFHRIVFHGGLPLRLAPSLFILIAPPALGFVAWIGLNGQVLDAPARMLLFAGLFLGAVLLSLVRLFLRVPFGLSWWAATFPTANLASAALLYHGALHSTATAFLAVGLLLGATAIAGLILIRSVQGLLAGTLLVPE